MIPKSSRFKCCHCGHLKKRPGKCVWCGKVANFDNLMGGGVESRHAQKTTPLHNWAASGGEGVPLVAPQQSGKRVSRISDRPAHHSNFTAPVLSNAPLLDNVKRKQTPQGPGKAKLPVRYEESGRRFKIAASANFNPCR